MEKIELDNIKVIIITLATVHIYLNLIFSNRRFSMVLLSYWNLSFYYCFLELSRSVITDEDTVAPRESNCVAVKTTKMH